MVETLFYFMDEFNSLSSLTFAFSTEETNRSQFEKFLARNNYHEATDEEKNRGTN